MKLAILEHLLQVPEDEVFATAKQLGFDGVELSFGAYQPTDRAIWQPGGPARLRQRAAEEGIEVPSLSAGYFNRHALIDPRIEARKKNIETLDQLIELCGQGEIPVLVVPCYGANELRRPADERLLRDVLQPLAAKAAAQNVILAIETLLPIDEQTQLLERLNSPAVQLSYDVGNARAAGRDVIAELRLLGDAICNIHIKDRDRREPFASVPLGQGMVEFEPTLRTLSEIGYDGWLVLDTPSGDEPLASARRNLEFLRGLAVTA